ncbi:NEL-type E3 ubiquitin ligase domain-containing protein [Pseudomonas sp. NPDC089408]|uniref:NEL-type E3 ubiquitin ligase domain-containing protein n=1 Tax=Pseudomonas sp. NPDC089408 TaxID=3364465 RepID=UPI003821CB6D
MTTPAPQQPPRVDTLAMEQAYQDSLIVKRLPRWIRRLRIVAPTDQNIPANGLYESEHAALRAALKDSLASRQWLQKQLARVEGIDHFVKPLLHRAMQERFGIEQDVDGLYFRRWYTYTAPRQGTVWGRYPVMEKDYFEVPLIEAALDNFTPGEGRDEQHKDNCVVDSLSQPLAAPSAPAFARLCRQLDLGGRYQQHLDAVLKAPGSQASGWRSMASTLAQLYSSVMLIDACKAKSDGVLTAAELQLVLDLCTNGRPGTFYASKVVARQLRAFDSDLQQIVVLEVLHEGWLFNASRKIIVYIPDDPHGPWTVSPDLESFTRKVLGKRLREARYQKFFRRFVRRRDSQQFYSRVASELVDVADWATREMGQHMRDYPLPLFEHLAAARIAHIKDDAAVIVTPVADLDRKAQEAHRRRLAAEGWTLASVAGVFVPALNALLLAVMVWDLLGELFQAVEDWREGDTSAAITHVLNVAKDVAVMGATAVVWREASRAWAALDRWVPARLEDGTEKLWNADLVPFRSAAPPAGAVADASGIYRVQDRSWMVMDDHYYEIVQRADEQWQLAPRDGHGPLVRHNGAGAWRLWTEQPADWADTHWMFRRLGARFARLDDEQIDQAMAIHALGADALRALHVYARPPEAELVDTVDRLMIDRRVQALLDGLALGLEQDDAPLLRMAQALPGVTAQDGPALAAQVAVRRRQLFQQLYDEQQAPEDAAVTTLRRAFPSLHGLAARRLVGELSVEGAEFQALLSGTVPFRLVTPARLSVLHIRVARACEALFIATPQSLDQAKVALTLLETLDTNQARPRWRLYDGDSPRPVMITAGDGQIFRLVHEQGEFVLEDALGIELRGPGELFEALSEAFDPAGRAALGINQPYAQSLRELLARQVSGRSGALAEALGKDPRQPWILTPLRLDDGRIGYPLGGSQGRLARPASRPRALAARLRDLYPAYSKAEVDAWLAKLHASGRDTDTALGVLEEQARLLNDHLRSWERSGVLAGERTERRRFRKSIMECWRERVPDQIAPEGNRLSLAWQYRGYELRSLPDMGPLFTFAHVNELSLRSLLLTEIPERFLLSFPNLTILDLGYNRLKCVPGSLALLGDLRILDLTGNQIVLDEPQAEVLGNCRQLRYLNLSNNRLQTALSVTRLEQLAELRLRNSGLAALPEGIVNHPRLYMLDASNNFITSLPGDFHQSRLWQNGYVSLSGNPVAARQETAVQEAWAIPEASAVPYKLRWADRLEGDQREDLLGLWMSIEQMDGVTNFLRLLQQLTRSRDFLHPRYGEMLAARILAMMEKFEASPALADEIFANAVVENCADNAAVVFQQLEIRCLIWDAEQAAPSRDQEGRLVTLARRLWRQHQVDLTALGRAEAAGAGNESIEWALAYSIRLREDLDLPVNARSMLHAGIPDLNDNLVASARTQILESETAESLAVWTVQQPFWRRYLEQRYARQLQVPERFHHQLPDNASSGEMDTLMASIRQWTEDTELQLTLAAVQKWV